MIATHIDDWHHRVTSPRTSRKSALSNDGQFTIEQRYEIEATLADLGLVDEQLPVSIGYKDRFQLRRLIGRGAMGAVYVARDDNLNRDVAIKVVGRGDDPRFQALLEREAQMLASAKGANIVPVFGLHTENDELFIAMEYIPRTLRDWQKDKSVSELIHAYCLAGTGLAAAHRAKIVHRDFKPTNVFIDEGGGELRIAVGDFGLAGPQSPPETIVDEAANDDPRAGRTPVGTLAYMAPEQLRCEHTGPLSDQHAFCVAMWEAISGKRPWRGQRPLHGDTAVPPRPPNMPMWLYRLLRRGLAFKRENRFDSVEELVANIRQGRWHYWYLIKPRMKMLGLVLIPIALGLLASKADLPLIREATASMRAAITGEDTIHWDLLEDCDDSATRLAEAWNEGTRSVITAAFGDYVVHGLDDEYEHWSKSAALTCRSGRSDSVEISRRDQAQQCTDRWADDIESSIQWLRSSSDDGSEDLRKIRATEWAASSRNEGANCFSTSAIPIDPEVDKELRTIEHLEFQLQLDSAATRAEALVDGNTDSATRTCGGRASEMTRTNSSSELAAAYYRLGHIQGERRKYGDAMDALQESYRNASDCLDHRRAAEAAIYMAKVLAHKLRDAKGAAVALTNARSALRQAGEPSSGLLLYEELIASGFVAEREGDTKKAKEYFSSAIDALGHPDSNPLLVAKALQNTARMEQSDGELLEAVETFSLAQGAIAGALGQEHPLTRLYASRRAYNLGLGFRNLGDLERMRVFFREATGSTDLALATRAYSAWAQGEYLLGTVSDAIERSNELLRFIDEHTAGDTSPPDGTSFQAKLPQNIAAEGRFIGARILTELESSVDHVRSLKAACDLIEEQKPGLSVVCKIALIWGYCETGQTDEARLLHQTLETLRRIDPSLSEKDSKAIGSLSTAPSARDRLPSRCAARASRQGTRQ